MSPVNSVQRTPQLALLRREWRRSTDRFRNVTATRVLSDIRRFVRLHMTEPGDSGAKKSEIRLVVSLTTTPERAARIVPTIRSLIDQSLSAHRLLLAWPRVSRRSSRPYPPLPPLPAEVEAIPCDDFGPATKLLPALRLEPNAALIAVDDDVIYPRDFLETLVEAHKINPKAALGFRGFEVDPEIDSRFFEHKFGTFLRLPTPADVLLGTWGYLIPPGAFDEAVHDFTGFPPEVRWVDDIWFSGHLASRGVPRLIVPARGFPIERLVSFRAALSFGANRSGVNEAVAIEAFRDFWTYKIISARCE